MKVPARTPAPRNGGFTLLEMMVNLGLLLVVMLVIAKIAGHTSETVNSNSGKLAAAEKSESLRHALQRDLDAVVRLDATEDALVSHGDEASWKLSLRIPGPGGWQEVDYHWSKTEGTMSRKATVDGKRVETVICTGITKFGVRWRESVSDDLKDAVEDWADGSKPPATGDFTFETTRAREEGKRDAVMKVHEESTRLNFILPVGGGAHQGS